MAFDLDDCLEKAYKKILLDPLVIKQICSNLKSLLVKQGNVANVKTPCTIVGDVHGQFYDLLEIFKIGGYCPSTNYVFLGDYVDRGQHSVELITLLVCLKLRYPSRVTLVRGNHESRAVTSTYGFYTECVRKFGDSEVWIYFTDLFDYLVLAVEIDNTILCLHGGLSPSIHSVDQIRVIDRFREIPHEGPMADLVWSDPIPASMLQDGGLFASSPRGAGYVFGPEVTRKFLSINNLSHICRGIKSIISAHQICMEGYQILFDDLLSTVWSAPNYCYRAGNLASILEISPSMERFYNVFGPCPDQEREIPVIPTVDRIAELFDADGTDFKKKKMESMGSDKGHALFRVDDVGYNFDPITVSSSGESPIDQYFT